MRGRQVGAGFLTMALVLAAGVAVATAPETEDVVAPFALAGRLGETVAGREVAVRVDAVRSTRELHPDGGAAALGTRGVWVLADVTVTALHETVSLDYATLTIGGTTYRTTSLLPSPALVSLTGFPFSPGVPVTGTLAFEVPRSALPAGAGEVRATLQVPRGFDARLDTVPSIEVPLDANALTPAEPVAPARVEDQQ